MYEYTQACGHAVARLTVLLAAAQPTPKPNQIKSPNKKKIGYVVVKKRKGLRPTIPIIIYR